MHDATAPVHLVAPAFLTAPAAAARYRGLAEAGVPRATVSLRDADGTAAVERFADVVAAFGPRWAARRVTGRT